MIRQVHLMLEAGDLALSGCFTDNHCYYNVLYVSYWTSLRVFKTFEPSRALVGPLQKPWQRLELRSLWEYGCVASDLYLQGLIKMCTRRLIHLRCLTDLIAHA